MYKVKRLLKIPRLFKILEDVIWNIRSDLNEKYTAKTIWQKLFYLSSEAQPFSYIFEYSTHVVNVEVPSSIKVKSWILAYTPASGLEVLIVWNDNRKACPLKLYDVFFVLLNIFVCNYGWKSRLTFWLFNPSENVQKVLFLHCLCVLVKWINKHMLNWLSLISTRTKRLLL